MFTKLNLSLVVLALTFTLTAFGAESNVAGRYHVDAANNSAPAVAQVGRYQAVPTASVTSIQENIGFALAGQSQVAGRYQADNQSFAPAEAYIAAPAYALMKTQRADAADVSNEPVVAPHDHK